MQTHTLDTYLKTRENFVDLQARARRERARAIGALFARVAHLFARWLPHRRSMTPRLAGWA